jgi:hypothetical protein
MTMNRSASRNPRQGPKPTRAEGEAKTMTMMTARAEGEAKTMMTGRGRGEVMMT